MSEQYVQRRLEWASRATELPASVQFDLALDDNFSDDHVDEIASHFGAQQDTGFGLSHVFQSLLSREPERVGVSDLQAYQQNLIDQGYAPAGTQATGVWDPFWNGAASRAERDAYSARIGGDTPVSTPFTTAFQFLGNLMPSKVFQGIVGMAKGIVEQAPESIARGGLVGGAAEGAAIGGTLGAAIGGIGAVPGALAGGLIGAVGGFFGDLFSSDDSEKGDSAGERLWDAITPWQEYTGKQGAQKLFEDLGFVASAAAIIQGAGYAVGGAAGLMGAEAAEEAGAALGGIRGGLAAGAERGFLTKAAESQPGLIARGLTSAKGTAAIGAAIGGGGTFVKTGDLSDTLKGALVGGAGGYGLGRFLPGVGEKLAGLSAEYGLGAQASRPLIQTINGAFSGVSRAQLTGRLAGALGDDSKIEQEIQAQDAHHSLVRDAIDNTLGFLVNPDGFFAFEGGKVASGFNKLLGSEAWLPYDLVATAPKADGSVSSFSKRVNEVAETLSPRTVGAGKGIDDLEVRANDFRLRVFFGIDMKTASDAKVFEKDLGTVDYMRERAKLRARNKRDVLQEWDQFEKGERTDTPLTEDLLSWSYGVAGDKEKGPTRFAAWIEDLGGKGSGLDRLGSQVTAEDVAEDLTRAVQEERLGVSFDGEELSVGEEFAREGGVGTKTGVKVSGAKPASKTTDPKAEELRSQAKKLTREIKVMESEAINSPDPVAANEAINTKKLEVKRLRKEAKSIPTIDSRREVTFTVANLDDPERNLLATPTMQMAERLSQKVADLTDTLKSSQREFQKALNTKEIEPHVIENLRGLFGEARDELTATVNDLQNRRLISHKQWEKATELLENAKTKSGAVHKGRPLESIAAHLDEVKDLFGREVELPQEFAARLPEGKTLIATGEDMIFSKDITHNLAAKNVDLYNANPNFFASLQHGFRAMGLSPTMHSNSSIFYLRSANQASEVHSVLADAGVELQGRSAMEMLRKGMDDLNHGDGVIHNGVKLHASAQGPVVRRVRTLPGGETKAEIGMYIADPRELSIGQIEEYLHLDELAPENVDPYELAGKVYHALKKGAALGADTSQMTLVHPMAGFRMIAKTLQVDGLPGFVEYMRTFHITNPTRTGAVLGAVTGAEIEREQGGDLGDIAKGAVVGGVTGGLAGKGVSARQAEVKGGFKSLIKLKFPKGSYGYLPDQLHRLSMAARYTFSFAFDLGRHWEQAMMGLTREDIPMFFRPRKYIEDKYGPGAWKEALNFYDNSIRKGVEMQQIEEVDRRLFQAGIAGYSPRNSEAARAFILRDMHPNMSVKEIEQRVTSLEGYGIGRRNIEKTINYVFFPYSFTKKLITSLGDFVLQEPGRALMIHEGYRRMYGLDQDMKNGDEDSFGAQFGEWLKKNLPLSQQLARLNNLAYGIGPGRFFLQGLGDHPTDLGTAFQALTSVFVPSGANTPITQFFGGLGDAAVHFFSPVVITDDPAAPTKGKALAWKEVLDTIDSFIPAIRDVTQFASGVDRQVQAALGGGDPFWQSQHYNDDKKAAELEIEPLAKALGYSSVAGFLNSSAGAGFKQAYDQRELEREAQYPIGYSLNQSFTNNVGLNEKALADLATKTNQTPAEQEIVRLRTQEVQLEQMAPLLGMSAEQLKLTYQQKFREEAAKFSDDKQFQMLWDRFFSGTFGPVVRAVA